ncbi:MAG: FliM/FliN family flagellar motor switch protein [Rhizobiaceae bacterium]
MLETEEITQLQERLKMLLPDRDSGIVDAPEVVSREKAEALETALNQAFASYDFLTVFKFLPQTGRTQPSFSSDSRILISYRLPKDEGMLFVSMPNQFVRSSLASALGAEGNAPAANRHNSLSPVELRFASALSHSLLPFVEVITGAGVELERVGSTVKDTNALTGKEFANLQFSTTWQGADTMFAIAAPARLLEKPAGTKKILQKHALANVMSNVVVKPEVRIRLQDTTLNELARLKPGDVIGLHANSPCVARVLVEGKEIMSGQIGRIGNHYSFRLNSRTTGPIRQSSTSPATGVHPGGQS